MQCAPCASNGPNHLGLCALQTGRLVKSLHAARLLRIGPAAADGITPSSRDNNPSALFFPITLAFTHVLCLRGFPLMSSADERGCHRRWPDHVGAGTVVRLDLVGFSPSKRRLKLPMASFGAAGAVPLASGLPEPGGGGGGRKSGQSGGGRQVTADERKMCTQAAIVRLLKRRREVGHDELVEVPFALPVVTFPLPFTDLSLPFNAFH